ncbi:MAG: Lrp/AsnC ligand binding domain-containing protein [Candidatus Odinarchaeota archaeon]
MAVRLAFILIRAQGGLESDVLDQLKTFKQVTQSYMIYGEWDIITIVEYEKLPELNTLVLQIRALPGVQQTSTLVVS